VYLNIGKGMEEWWVNESLVVEREVVKEWQGPLRSQTGSYSLTKPASTFFFPMRVGWERDGRA
jgi:hypothetical protein